MKKRIVGMLVVLMIICGILPANAAGGIVPTEETWYVVSHSGDYRVYYYAAVTNNSGEPEKIKDLLFEIRDRADTTIESTAKYKLYPEILEPGQTGWLVVSLDVKDIETKSLIDHYALTITSKLVDDKAARMLIAEAEYLDEDEDENEDMIRTAITNSGTGNAFEITVALVVRDGEGKLLFRTIGYRLWDSNQGQEGRWRLQLGAFSAILLLDLDGSQNDPLKDKQYQRG